ncbi:hypothetical protein ACOSP7_009669 [Xanthoceras sorbifolium]
MASGTNHLAASFSPQFAKALAIKRGVEVALESGLCPFVLESEASSVVSLINNRTIPLFEIGLVLFDIAHLVSDERCLGILFIPQVVNGAAYSLANLACLLDYNFIWMGIVHLQSVA